MNVVVLSRKASYEEQWAHKGRIPGFSNVTDTYPTLSFGSAHIVYETPFICIEHENEILPEKLFFSSKMLFLESRVWIPWP